MQQRSKCRISRVSTTATEFCESRKVRCKRTYRLDRNHKTGTCITIHVSTYLHVCLYACAYACEREIYIYTHHICVYIYVYTYLMQYIYIYISIYLLLEIQKVHQDLDGPKAKLPAPGPGPLRPGGMAPETCPSVSFKRGPAGATLYGSFQK